MDKEDRLFKHWKEDDIIVELGLSPRYDCQILKDWLNAEMEITEEERQFLKKKQQKAAKYIGGWNEQELQTKYIAPITELVDFDSLEYFFMAFSERKIEINYKKIPLKGKVDWMVAIGKNEPRLPFFFIHEYKKQKGYDADPKGQLLASMLAAHVLNQQPEEPTLFKPYPNRNKNMPIYGCYIIGRLWVFVTLQNGTYCESQAFDSVDLKDLFKIVQILKKQKMMIIERIKMARKGQLSS